MLLVSSIYSRSISFAYLAILMMLIISYASCSSSSSSCGNKYYHRSASHHASHGGGSCIRSDAMVRLQDRFELVENVKKGELVFTEDHDFALLNKTCCHHGNFTLWKMPGYDESITTPNHPIKIGGEWFAGNPKGALDDFGMNVKFSGTLSNDTVETVCSLETINEKPVAIVVFFNGEIFMVAD